MNMLIGAGCLCKIIHSSKQDLELQIFCTLLDDLMMTKAILQIVDSLSI